MTQRVLHQSQEEKEKEMKRNEAGKSAGREKAQDCTEIDLLERVGGCVVQRHPRHSLPPSLPNSPANTASSSDQRPLMR